MARKPVSKPVEIIPDNPPLVFTNETAHTTIHLGDGRKLAPGESVEVPAALYAILTGAA